MGGRQTTELKIACEQGEYLIDFEPLGNVLTLREDDYFVVHFPNGEPSDVEIMITKDGISIWPQNDIVRVTNKAGKVLIDPG